MVRNRYKKDMNQIQLMATWNVMNIVRGSACDKIRRSEK